MLLKSVPLLPALHIRNTIDFYEKKLGCTAVNYGNYAIITYGEVEIHFYLTNDKIACEKSRTYIRVKNIEDLYANLSILGIIHPEGTLEDNNRGMKEFSIVDNNGNLIVFGQRK